MCRCQTNQRKSTRDTEQAKTWNDFCW